MEVAAKTPADRLRTEGRKSWYIGTTSLVHPYRTGATLSGVYVPVPVETVSLDVLHRAGWQPVSRDMVDGWFTDRSWHAGVCPLAVSGREKIGR